MRLFVAVRPPPNAPGMAGVRDPHVTLCFLGEVADDAVPEVVDGLAGALRGQPACEAEVAAGGPRPLGPSAIVRRVDGLDELAAIVRRAVGRYAARPDDRPFRGHLTVARRRRGEGAVQQADAPAIRWRVDEVALVRSELGRGPGGTARHTDVAVVALG